MSGLKYVISPRSRPKVLVSPFMGEWIEMEGNSCKNAKKTVSPFMGEWIEILALVILSAEEKVSPFMGEWIER